MPLKDPKRVVSCLRVVIASPGDVLRERDALPEVLEQLNRGLARDRGYRLELFRWETDTHPAFHAQGPQGAVDSGLQIQDCDILIGVFWKRFGTPVADAGSGTEHELRLAYETWSKTQSRPLIMLYFNKEPYFPETQEDLKQAAKVLDFKSNFAREALYGEYRGATEFTEKVRNDLTHVLRSMEPHNPLPHLGVLPPLAEPPGANQDRPPGEWSSLALGKTPLYTFCGLRREIRDLDLFQDFKVDRLRYENPNPIAFLWADVYRGGSITAYVVEADPPHLSITFENKPSSWPCNLAIRPRNERAISKRERKTFTFEARVAPDSSGGSTASSEFYASVRVINGWAQHWAYGPGSGRYQLLQITPDWSVVKLPLASGDWWLFGSDGNHFHGPEAPDFSIIAGLVIEFGTHGLDRVGPGAGTVLLRTVGLQE